MSLKKIVKKLIFKEKADSDTYIKYLKDKGVRIGDRVTIYEPRSNVIDVIRPWMIEIGNDVKITYGVTILTHGYDWSVLAGKHDVVLGSSGKVKIGNNVFIGMHSTILKGVNIGNNVIIGANSLVNKDVPDDVVVAGNPARVIMSVEEYYEKHKAMQKEEALELYVNYRDVYEKNPPKEVFSEFFWLFQNDSEELHPSFKKQMSHHGRYDETLVNLKNSTPEFPSYEEFVYWLDNEYEKNRKIN